MPFSLSLYPVCHRGIYFHRNMCFLWCLYEAICAVLSWAPYGWPMHSFRDFNDWQRVLWVDGRLFQNDRSSMFVLDCTPPIFDRQFHRLSLKIFVCFLEGHWLFRGPLALKGPSCRVTFCEDLGNYRPVRDSYLLQGQDVHSVAYDNEDAPNDHQWLISGRLYLTSCIILNTTNGHQLSMHISCVLMAWPFIHYIRLSAISLKVIHFST